jgi:hypothetical protein
MRTYYLPFSTNLQKEYPPGLPVGNMPRTNKLFRLVGGTGPVIVEDRRDRVAPSDRPPGVRTKEEIQQWLDTRIRVIEFDSKTEYEEYVAQMAAGPPRIRTAEEELEELERKIRREQGGGEMEGGAAVGARRSGPPPFASSGGARTFEEATEPPRNP